MILKKNMGVMTVAAKLVEISARIVLVVYGLVFIVSFIWFIGSVKFLDFLSLVGLLFSTVLIGFTKKTIFIKNRKSKYYYFFGVIGFILSIELIYNYTHETKYGIYDAVDKILLSIAFLTMMALYTAQLFRSKG